MVEERKKEVFNSDTRSLQEQILKEAKHVKNDTRLEKALSLLDHRITTQQTKLRRAADQHLRSSQTQMKHQQ